MRMTEAGRFQAVGVPPGRYQLIARWTQQGPRVAGAGPEGQVPGTQWYAQQQIDVTGVDLSGINLAFAPPITVSGKVVFDGAPPGGDAQIQVRLDSAGRAPTGSFARSIKPADGGEFSITNVTPGRYRLNAFVTVPNPGAVAPGTAPPPWQVRSAADRWPRCARNAVRGRGRPHALAGGGDADDSPPATLGDDHRQGRQGRTEHGLRAVLREQGTLDWQHLAPCPFALAPERRGRRLSVHVASSG